LATTTETLKGNMARKRVYISGPISNGGKATADERLANVAKACEVAADLMSRGFSVFCPQLTEYIERLTNQDFAHQVWMEVDFPWVEVSDVVLRLPGESLGSDLEVGHAQIAGVPVVFTVEQLERWLQCEAEMAESQFGGRK
jgi:hypothetical protein